jgi:hypothetical protein
LSRDLGRLAAILGLLDDRIASPRELSEQLDAPLKNVSCHVRELVKLKLIKLVRTRQRRAALEHHYTALLPICRQGVARRPRAATAAVQRGAAARELGSRRSRYATWRGLLRGARLALALSLGWSVEWHKP